MIRTASWFPCVKSLSLSSLQVRQSPYVALSANPKAAPRTKIQNLKWIGAFVVLLALTQCGAAAQAQQTKIPKIGFLGVRADDATAGVEIFRREFRALGYVEGKNFTFEYRNAENKLDRLPALVDDLIRLKVDVIVAAATNETQAIKKATGTIPIVGLNLGDPIVRGFVASYARLGGNITGFATINTLPGKRLEVLKDAIPKLTRVAVLWQPQSSSSTAWSEHEIPARALGLQLHSMEVNTKEHFEAAFKDATKAGSGALSVALSALINSHQKQVAELAAKYRLPAIYPRREFVDSGGLMSYGTDREEPFKRVAVMVDKILKGAKPADIPVEQPTKFEFIINLKAAKQIGLTIPPEVLTRADKVIR